MLEQRQTTLSIMNKPGHCGTVLMGFLNTHDFVLPLVLHFQKRKGCHGGPSSSYLFIFEVQPQHSRDYFCRSHFLASILTNTCDATFSAASSSFIIIMVRVRSCRILFKLTFSKPLSFYLAWWYLVSSQSELSETAPFLSRSSYEMA